MCHPFASGVPPEFSVHELEKCVGVINAAGVHEVVSGKLSDPKFRRWGYATYCNDQYPNEVANLLPLFRDEYDSMFVDLA
jgi:hypothetical protein